MGKHLLGRLMVFFGDLGALVKPGYANPGSSV